jgi:hypothetical protein
MNSGLNNYITMMLKTGIRFQRPLLGLTRVYHLQKWKETAYPNWLFNIKPEEDGILGNPWRDQEYLDV